MRIALGLVKIQKREAIRGSTALLLEQFQAQDCHLDSRQGVACPRPKFVDVQVHRQIGIADEVLQKAGIAGL